MKVAIFEEAEWERQAYAALGPDYDVTSTPEPLNERTFAHADAEIVSTRTGSDLGADMLRRFPNLRLVATRSTGFDHVDREFCRTNGIVVCNVPGYGDVTVAEHVFALLLALGRHLTSAVERTRRGDFSQAGLRGFELSGKVLGVIGTGRIGRCAIRIARGFGMQVLAFDRYPDPEAAQALGFRYEEFDAVLRQADVVTLHVPATRQTTGLLSDREFGMMRKGAVLINTARGEVVDAAALVRALVDGKLAGAGLDVLPDETLVGDEARLFAEGTEGQHDLRALVANHVLLRFPNVLVTPHNAYNTNEAVRRIVDTTIANIGAFAAGQPENVVSG
ncbi:hydroxyacid dehydrogenase [Microvirga sp. 3-52]|nr:hydroxyacid dehydrogenase [Microvirga sp. 3-52]